MIMFLNPTSNEVPYCSDGNIDEFSLYYVDNCKNVRHKPMLSSHCSDRCYVPPIKDC